MASVMSLTLGLLLIPMGKKHSNHFIQSKHLCIIQALVLSPGNRINHLKLLPAAPSSGKPRKHQHAEELFSLAPTQVFKLKRLLISFNFLLNLDCQMSIILFKQNHNESFLGIVADYDLSDLGLSGAPVFGQVP